MLDLHSASGELRLAAHCLNLNTQKDLLFTRQFVDSRKRDAPIGKRSAFQPGRAVAGCLALRFEESSAVT